MEIPSTFNNLINTVEEIRSQITSHLDGVLNEVDFQLINRSLAKFKKIKTVEIFLNDCNNCRGQKLNFSSTRDFIFEKHEPIVLSFFKAPYNKEYGLDAFIYTVQAPDEHFVKKFSTSNSTSINIIKSTFGFQQYPLCVALFPENFIAPKICTNKFSVFYFVNIFEQRFQHYGAPTLERFVDSRSFWRLKRLTKEFRLKAFATWHYLHEYFHSCGELPITEYLNIKSTRKVAALEESRVDVLSIITCLNSVKEGFHNGLVYAELILFERMIRYSIHSDPETNYDAKASYTLFGFLHSLGSVDIRDTSLEFNRLNLLTSLEKYASEIDSIEKETKDLMNNKSSADKKNLRSKLENFVNIHSSSSVELKSGFINNVNLALRDH